VGHYIVIYGYCPEAAAFLCMDPAGRLINLKQVHEDTLDRARQVRGTDEDLIFICLNGRHPTESAEWGRHPTEWDADHSWA